ncbi:MAG TPA: response regulator [Labilithrix sp.]|nr:response regulator [Labilithrix sp.]
MRFDPEIEADIAAAVEGFAWVEAVYTLTMSDAASAHPDALSFAIVLAPYGINELVKTHYAVLVATGSRAATGRVLYVNGAMAPPTPLARARRIASSPEERESARRRIAQRRGEADEAERRSGGAPAVDELERAFRQLAQNASRDSDNASAPAAPSPYRASPGKSLDQYSQAELQELVDRAFAGSAITATFASGAAVVEIVRDPFPARARRRILVADDDPATLAALRGLVDVDVVYAHDGWTAIDQLTEGTFALALCAVVLGDFTGAKIHRIVAKARPEMASRMVFIARESVVAQAPPSSASARVLSRPIDPAAVLALLERLG